MTAPDYIKRMQGDVAKIKTLFGRVEKDALALVKIDRAERDGDAEADGMIWLGCVKQVAGMLEAGHGVASKALDKHYPGERGPGR